MRIDFLPALANVSTCNLYQTRERVGRDTGVIHINLFSFSSPTLTALTTVDSVAKLGIMKRFSFFEMNLMYRIPLNWENGVATIEIEM